MAKRPAQPQRAALAEVLPPTIWAQRPSGLLVQLAAGSYRAAENPRRRFRIIDGTGDFHLDDYTRQMLRSQSRDLERNNTWYDAALGNFATYIVGSGPRPIFQSADDAWNKAALELWQADAAGTALDARGLSDWATWCTMLTRAVVRDGDSPVIHTDDARALQLESERIDSLRLDDYGRIVGASLIAQSPSGWNLPGQGTPIDTSRFSLPAWRTRSSQTRGHPACAAGLDEWERIDSLNEAEIISAETASLPWLMLQSQPGTAAGQAPPRNRGGLSGPGAAAPDGWVKTDAGSIIGLPPGVTGQAWTPNRPNLNVPEFVRLNLRGLCTPLLPYEVLFVDLNGFSYAAVRALGKLSQRKIKDFRSRVLLPVISRILRDWARIQILRKRLPYVRDYARHRWDWDELEIRDREKDATAVEKEMANGTTTLQDVVGPTWRDKVQQRAAEQQAAADLDVARVVAVHRAIQAAKQANPDLDLHWSQIVTLAGAESAPGAHIAGAAPATTPTALPAVADPAQLTRAGHRMDDAQMRELVARLDRLDRAPQIVLQNSHQVKTEDVTSLATALAAAMPTPVVNVAAPVVNVAAPAVTVQPAEQPAPIFQVPPAPAPVVQVSTPVQVNVPEPKPLLVQDVPGGGVLISPQE
jgi:capsid protein